MHGVVAFLSLKAYLELPYVPEILTHQLQTYSSLMFQPHFGNLASLVIQSSLPKVANRRVAQIEKLDLE